MLLPWGEITAATFKWALEPGDICSQDEKGSEETKKLRGGPAERVSPVSVCTEFAFVSQGDYAKSPGLTCISALVKGKCLFKENQHYQFNLLA